MPLEDTVLALKTLYGVDLGIKTEKFYALSKLIQQLSGFQLPPNRPIVGDSLYHIESGIVAMFHRRCRNVEPLEYMPFAPSKWWDGRGSTSRSARAAASRTSRSTSSAAAGPRRRQANDILARVKQKSMEKHSLLTGEEFDEIMNAVLA